SAPDRPDLPSFPTRRSSDLAPRRGTQDPGALLQVRVDLLPGGLDHPGHHRGVVEGMGQENGPERVEDAELRTGEPPECPGEPARSEEHTSELQSRENLVCRL